MLTFDDFQLRTFYLRIMSNGRLSLKEQLFAENYLCAFNASDVALKAGYSEHTARQQGYENLTKPYIKTYIQDKAQDKLQKLGINQDRVIAEIAKIAFADVTEFFNDDWSMKQVSEIDPTKTPAIKSVI
jgi:phage terminase small subunit